MQQLENDLDQTQEKLMNANQRLEEKEKALQNVSAPLSDPINTTFSLSSINNKPWHNKAKEEVEALEKKMVQLENELAQTQTNLETASHNLEEKEKALQNVRRDNRFLSGFADIACVEICQWNY